MGAAALGDPIARSDAPMPRTLPCSLVLLALGSCGAVRMEEADWHGRTLELADEPVRLRFVGARGPTAIEIGGEQVTADIPIRAGYSME